MASHRKRGVTVLEVLVAITVVVIAIGIAFSWMAASGRRRTDISDLHFAKDKVAQIFDELEAYVESGQEINARSLDQFNEPTPTPVLTIRNVSPDHPLSGNKPGSGPGGWYYYKQITVQPLANPRDPSARLVTIRFFRAVNGELKELLATSTVIRTLINKTPPRQVYDVYFLAIANVPGWWVRTSTLRNVVDGALKEILMRNPNLEIRAHWITVMGYGRDPYYAPFISEDFEENPQGRPRFGRMAYYYLGTTFIYTGAHEKVSYFTTPFFKAKLNAMIDGEQKVLNVDSFSIADQYNHAVRYPEAVRIYRNLVREAIDRGEPIPEPPYQLLFEKFYFEEGLKNPIVINLHGEMIPFPPVRNYSDPSKRPDIPELRGVRLVVHPENIAYPNGSQVRFRVYAFYTNPDRPETNNQWIDHDRLRYATLLIGPVTSSTAISFQAIDGGVPRATGSSGAYNPNTYTRYVTFSHSYCPSYLPPDAQCTPGGMGYRYEYMITTEGTFILVHLYGIPLKTPFRNNKGLPANYRLFGLEYVPTPLGPRNNPFLYDLASNNSLRGPVNTARLIITLTNVPTSPSREEPLTLRYAIGELNLNDMFTRGRPFVDATYTWVGYTIDWRTSNLPEIPITEQYQYQGDPRLNPYADIKWAHRYNWFFPMRQGDNWRADWKWRRDNFFWRGRYSWNGVPVDVPAFFTMVRTSYQRAQAVYTSMTGFSNYYIALGGEIGGDAANQVRYGPPVNARLYGGRESSFVYEKAITQDGYYAPSQRGLKNVVDTVGNWDNASWGSYALPFLGELYPDSMWDYWREHGNLPTPRFQRRRWRDSLPGRDFPNYTQVRTATPGCVSFFNAVPIGYPNSYSGRFSHNWGGTGYLTRGAEEGEELFNTFSLPYYSVIPAPRPFSINTYINAWPPEWWSSQYMSVRQRNRVLRTFYRSSRGWHWHASGVVENYDPRDPSRVFRVVVNGLAPSGTEANSFLARYAIASTLFTFLIAGNPMNYSFTDIPPIQQLPRVVITSPNYGDVFVSGTELHVTYNLEWRRWDGKKYTSAYPDNYNGGNFVVTVKWQRTGENVWHYLDNTETQAGAYPDEIHQILADIGSNTVVIDTDGWRGSYMIRVEVFREGHELHYSYHEILVFIQ